MSYKNQQTCNCDCFSTHPGIYSYDSFESGDPVVYNNNLTINTYLIKLKDNAPKLFNSYQIDTLNVEHSYTYDLLSDNAAYKIICYEKMNKIRYLLNHSYPLITDLNYLRLVSNIPSLSIEQVIAATQALIWDICLDNFCLNQNTNENIKKFYNYLKGILNDHLTSLNLEKSIKDLVIIIDKHHVEEQVSIDNVLLGPYYLKSHSVVARQYDYTLQVTPGAEIVDGVGTALSFVKIDEPFYIRICKCTNLSKVCLSVNSYFIAGYNPIIACAQNVPCNAQFTKYLLFEQPIHKCINICEDIYLFKILITKLDGATHCPLQGVGFRIYDRHHHEIETLYTDSQGLAMSDILIKDAYIISEIAPPLGYLPISSVEIDGCSRDEFIYNLTVNNYTNVNYEIVVRLCDSVSDDPLRMGVFKLYSEDGQFIAEATTDIDGKVVFNNLLPGRYQVKQTIAPQGYNVNSRTFDAIIRSQGVVQIDVTDNRNSCCCFGTLKICKYDHCDHNIPLVATFGIYRRNQLIRTVTTNSRGAACTTLSCGNCCVRELIPPVGYQLDTRWRGVNIRRCTTTRLNIENRRTPL